jgi:malate synthase
VPEGTRTEAGLRHNVRVGVQYLEAWLRGQGCVPIYNLMEDAATAEISRTQVWQWVRYGATLEGGSRLTPDRLRRVVAEELRVIEGEVGAVAFGSGRYPSAAALFERLATAPECEEFLTLSAYDQLESTETGESR